MSKHNQRLYTSTLVGNNDLSFNTNLWLVRITLILRTVFLGQEATSQSYTSHPSLELWPLGSAFWVKTYDNEALKISVRQFHIQHWGRLVNKNTSFTKFFNYKNPNSWNFCHNSYIVQKSEAPHMEAGRQPLYMKAEVLISRYSSSTKFTRQRHTGSSVLLEIFELFVLITGREI